VLLHPTPSYCRADAKACRILAAGSQSYYATYLFFAALNFAQRERAAAAILFLPAAEIFRVRFTAEPFVFGTPAADCAPFLALAHLAFCASAIFRRKAADMTRVGWFAFRDVPVPFNDSITEIA